jgi:hypothetical protein
MKEQLISIIAILYPSASGEDWPMCTTQPRSSSKLKSVSFPATLRRPSVTLGFEHNFRGGMLITQRSRILLEKLTFPRIVKTLRLSWNAKFRCYVPYRPALISTWVSIKWSTVSYSIPVWAFKVHYISKALPAFWVFRQNLSTHAVYPSAIYFAN